MIEFKVQKTYTKRKRKRIKRIKDFFDLRGFKSKKAIPYGITFFGVFLYYFKYVQLSTYIEIP